jgi:hypothetical protein
VLTELILRKPPAPRNVKDKYVFKVDSFVASLPPDCPVELAQLVIDCTQFNPSDRPEFSQLLPRLKTLMVALEEEEKSNQQQPEDEQQETEYYEHQEETYDEQPTEEIPDHSQYETTEDTQYYDKTSEDVQHENAEESVAAEEQQTGDNEP